jgi:hypothetical protein
MQKLAMAVIDAKGAPMTGVTVTVKDAGTANNASIFSDNGSTAKANPFLNEANGSYEFYAANGRYDIQLVKTGVTFVAADTSDIALYDPADAAAAFGAPVYTDELTGLGLANGTDATNDINIGVGAAASDDATITSRVLMTVTSVLTKQLDATWAAGNNAGGRVSGQSLADGTWHVFLFRRSGGQDDVCFSNTLSFTLPDSGTKRRRIGSIVRASGAILGFQQDGDLFRWTTKPALDFNTTSGTSANTVTLTVPLGIVVWALGAYFQSAISMQYFSALDETDEAPSSTAVPLGQGTTSGVVGQLFGPLKTNTSGQIRMRSSVSVTIRISTHGWLDRRGRG